MRGTEIVLAADPKGKFLEGYVTTSGLLPGTLMVPKASGTEVSGRTEWVQWVPSSDGLPNLIAVLLPDDLQGQIVSASNPINIPSGATSYRIKMYVPLPGEEMNILCAPGDVVGTGTGTEPGTGTIGTGTADTTAFTVGQQLMQGTVGFPVPSTGSPTQKPFTCMEAITVYVTGYQPTWVYCIRA
jgi:hypothetical protein